MAYRHVLSGDEKCQLLHLARLTLREFTESGRYTPRVPDPRPLREGAGAFVTLRRAQSAALRGCIGTQKEELPLYRTVQEMTVAAASRDPRFSPVSPEEVPGLTIEISVLGDRREAEGAHDVEVGRHGVAITCRGRHGLLLPQVAPENGWDAATLLSRLCLKAGLADDAWRTPEARIESFTAQVFDEAALAPEPERA